MLNVNISLNNMDEVWATGAFSSREGLFRFLCLWSSTR